MGACHYVEHQHNTKCPYGTFHLSVYPVQWQTELDKHNSQPHIITDLPTSGMNSTMFFIVEAVIGWCQTWVLPSVAAEKSALIRPMDLPRGHDIPVLMCEAPCQAALGWEGILSIYWHCNLWQEADCGQCLSITLKADSIHDAMLCLWKKECIWRAWSKLHFLWTVTLGNPDQGLTPTSLV